MANVQNLMRKRFAILIFPECSGIKKQTNPCAAMKDLGLKVF